jgi:hypothetical protein
MSIVDSAANLSTTWTEQTVVGFTSGVLSTINDCVSEVESKLKRGTLSATTSPTLIQVKNWLKRGKLELMEFKNYTFARKYAYADGVAGQYRYALPPDFNGGTVRLRDITNDSDIALWMPEWYDRRFPDPSEFASGVVTCATIKYMELWTFPAPSGSDRLELEYSRSGAETTADDFSFLPELSRFRCCDFALSHAFESLHMFDVADRFRQYWDIGLAKSVRADNRKKRGGKRLCVINVFQEAAALGYQPKSRRGTGAGGGGITFGGTSLEF